MHYSFQTLVRSLPVLLIPLLLLASCGGRQTEDISAADYAKADEISARLNEYLVLADGEHKIKRLAPEVLPALTKASAAQPENSNYHFALYLCYAFTGDKKAALREIESAYSYSSQDSKYLMSYVLALRLDWQPIKARDLMAAYSNTQGKSLETESFVAQLNMAVQEYQKAAKVFERWLDESGVEHPKERSTILLHLGTCYLYLGRHDEAIDCFEQAVNLYPENILAKRRWFSALVRKGKPEDAIAFCSKELKGHEDSESVRYHKGLAFELLGKSQEARQQYEEALEIGEKRLKVPGDNGEAHFILSRVCGKLGLDQKSMQYKENAAQLSFAFEPPEVSDSPSHAVQHP